MTEWSAEAKVELEAYLTHQRNALSGSDVNVDEVINDLRSHIDEEVKAAGFQVVTREDISRILQRVGPSAASEDREIILPSRPNVAEDKPKPKPGVALIVFGVMLPAISILFELVSHVCARTFFDPIPTWWHILAVALVPIINALTISRLRRGSLRHPVFLTTANAAAIAVSFFYAIAFIPLLIPGLVAVFYFGFGLLPMGPLFAFIAALRCRYYVTTLSGESFRTTAKEFSLGIVIATLFLGGLEFTNLVTRVGLELADSELPATQRRGIRLLRSLGNETTMLRACYERPRNFTNLAGLFISPDNDVHQEDARMIFFRVTGKPFNSVRPPRLYTRNGRWDIFDEMTWDFDDGLGGTAVAGRVRGLSLTGSRLDSHVHSQAGLAYLEWTFEFTNQTPRQREARTQILLPADGVVSRLTLWVNGEEREAAFAGRAETRAAYQEVAIRQRRDPVLVTTSGTDRILMQCFPIPPNGGMMKVRLGITAPLAMGDLLNAKLQLPKMVERNFNLAPDLEHALWIESRSELSSSLKYLTRGIKEKDESTLYGQVPDADLISPQSTIHIIRPKPTERVWSTSKEESAIILQNLVSAPTLNIDRLAIVIDGSAGMESFYPEIARSLEHLPLSVELFIVHASDIWTNEHIRSQGDTPLTAELAATRIPALEATGGQDNLRWLIRAWDIASGKTNGAVLWIHGPQPITLSSQQALQQRLERSPSHPKLFEIQTVVGPNRLLEPLGPSWIQPIPRFSSLEDDLSEWFIRLEPEAQAWQFDRKAVPLTSVPDLSQIPKVTDHVRRLWAAAQVETLAAQKKHAPAAKLAGQHQLVTSVSGAVVLETKEQFERAGLNPVDPVTVPVIPEPQTWLLLCLGAVVLACFSKRRA
ncbi:MAG: hypothetical protein M2R45_00471 [Verrucomicrobia subdivision 3 bacterium]|nr:hypothetical protein [Limisphaerales bacterium]MCS1413650.1 hypothetical protein [Limisphaerales bacterium]